jgi:hypothetical protein
MINLRRAAAVAAAALGLALGALAAPASASTIAPEVGGTAQGSTHGTDAVLTVHGAGALKNNSVSPNFSACPVTAFGYGGEMICGTVEATYTVNGTPKESFVIGTDWAVWHAWPGSNGWHSLHGQALHFTGTDSAGRTSGVFGVNSAHEAVWVWGTDGNPWCSQWGIPNWTSWQPC